MDKSSKIILNEMKTLIKQEGTQTAAASKLGVGLAYFNDILNGRRKISSTIARKFGYDWQLVKIDSVKVP